MSKNVRSRLGVILLLCMGVVVSGALDRQTRGALKVGHILKTIAKAPPPDGRYRSAAISGQELNAYIAWRLAREPDTVIKRLDLDLLDNNHVAGTLRFDAARLNLDKLLGEALDFDFKGIVYTRNRAARLELIALTLCGQPVNPQVLDFVLATAARYQGAETGGLNDGYALPEGVDHLMVTKDSVLLYY